MPPRRPQSGYTLTDRATPPQSRTEMAVGDIHRLTRGLLL